MESKWNRLLFATSAATCIAVVATAILYYPKLPIVFDLSGPTVRKVDAISVADSPQQAIPATFDFIGRLASYATIQSETISVTEYVPMRIERDPNIIFAASDKQVEAIIATLPAHGSMETDNHGVLRKLNFAAEKLRDHSQMMGGRLNSECWRVSPSYWLRLSHGYAFPEG